MVVTDLRRTFLGISRRLVPGLLVCLPILVLVQSLDQKKAGGAYWEEPKADPSYDYLVGSLAYAIGQQSMCCLHPGVTAQVNGAWVLKFTHSILRSDDFVTDVLREPEVYARWLGFEQSVIYAAAIAIAGFLVYRATRRLELGVLIQLPPFVSPAYFQWLNPIAPEAILFSVVILVAALCISYHVASPRKPALFAILLGCLSGTGGATKITYLPTGLLPLLVLNSWVERLAYVVSTCISFAVISVPHWATVDNAIYYWKQLFLKRGLHASGPAGSPQLADLLGSVNEYFQSDPVYMALCGLSAVFAAILLATGRRRKDASPWGRHVIALLICELAQIALASRQFNPRYLSPAFALMCSSLVIFFIWARKSYPEAGRYLTAICWIGAGLLVVFDLNALARKSTLVRAARNELQTLEHQLEPELAASKVIAYYGASSVPAALHSGDTWAYRRFGAKLAELYPDRTFWNAYDQTFETFEGPFRRLGDCSRTILRGAPFGLQPMGFSPPPGFTVVEIGRARREAFYRIQAAPCLAPKSTSAP